MKMNDRPGNALTQLFAWFAVLCWVRIIHEGSCVHDFWAGGLIWSASHCHGKYLAEEKRAVTAGDKRLHLNTTYKPVSKAPGSTSLDDTTSLGLTDAAERDYFRLRKRIETSNKQIARLQEYIRKQYVK